MISTAQSTAINGNNPRMDVSSLGTIVDTKVLCAINGNNPRMDVSSLGTIGDTKVLCVYGCIKCKL